jgi:hypothetical protein
VIRPSKPHEMSEDDSDTFHTLVSDATLEDMMTAGARIPSLNLNEEEGIAAANFRFAASNLNSEGALHRREIEKQEKKKVSRKVGMDKWRWAGEGFQEGHMSTVAPLVKAPPQFAPPLPSWAVEGDDIIIGTGQVLRRGHPPIVLVPGITFKTMFSLCFMLWGGPAKTMGLVERLCIRRISFKDSTAITVTAQECPARCIRTFSWQGVRLQAGGTELCRARLGRFPPMRRRSQTADHRT